MRSMVQPDVPMFLYSWHLATYEANKCYVNPKLSYQKSLRQSLMCTRAVASRIFFKLQAFKNVSAGCCSFYQLSITVYIFLIIFMDLTIAMRSVFCPAARFLSSQFSEELGFSHCPCRGSPRLHFLSTDAVLTSVACCSFLLRIPS